MFTVVDAAMLRMATQPVTAGEWPDVAGDVPQWRGWLARAWADEQFANAVGAASPDLARRVAAVCAGKEVRPRQVRGAVLSLLRYRLRASSRATPFGLFAGVAPVRFGPTTLVHVGDQHHLTERVDAVWLSSLVSELERCDELITRLPVVLNNTAVERDGRLIINLRQHPNPDAARTDPAEVTVRYTRAIALVVRNARTPILMSDLVDRLSNEFPDVPPTTIASMVATLVEQRVLLTGLRPPMTSVDPVRHVLTALAQVDADQVPATSGIVARLHERPAVVADGGTDMRVDAQVVLPETVAREVEHAANVLARLTPHPFGAPRWLDFHARFLERYGIGAAVPLLELADPDLGLGYPAGYRDSLLDVPAPATNDRDVALLRLAQTAAMNRRVEVILDESAITELEAPNFGQAQLFAHAELAVRLHAPSPAALGRGDFSLVVTGAFRAAGTTAGRFLDMLDESDRDRMVRAYTDLPSVNADGQRVQVSCPPLYTETENVSRHPQVLPNLIPIGEYRPAFEREFAPEDLVVIGDAHRFTLWSRSTARPLEPEVFSAVEFTNFSHPLLRLVCELTTGRAATWGPFSWGIATQLPFLPRLTYRRTVLAPARWTLNAADLPAKSAPWAEWNAAIDAWRESAMAPAMIYLGGNDQRLRLNLDEAAHLYLLRAQLDRHGHATMQEAPRDDAFGWIGEHAHEIIVPLASTKPRAWPALPPRATPLHATTAHDGHLPGAGEWLYCKLYGHPDRHSAVLASYLTELLPTLDETVQWWFLPYRDPDNHLRLRIRLTDPAQFGPVAAELGAWAMRLRQRGLIATMQMDTYLPETGRFGHGPTMAAAEDVFAADSVVALAQRTHLTSPGAVDDRALVTASLVDLATGFTGDQAAAATWLIEHITTGSASAHDRRVYDQALHLSDPRAEQAAIRNLPGGEQIATAWTARRTAVANYRAALTQAGGPPPNAVLGSLLHLHSVRTLGISPDAERTSHRLARAAALSQTSYRKGRRCETSTH
ncbi:thiopeptide-type bacteriocin biosynthesis domain-containing protein [Actinokineospora globicatena]|nr:thiopeptide-type bacteriocin biosynthesis domain-containing protein [Actinokineospora globicatena]